MASIGTQLESVELRGLAPGHTKANRLPIPTEASVRWSSRRVDTMAVAPLASGLGRDVFASDAVPYVLKLQRAQWHSESNKAEVASALRKAMKSHNST